MKSSLKLAAKTLRMLGIVAFFGLCACSETTYVHQNGTYYNDYEAVNHYRVQNASKAKKVKSQSKSPNWKRYNTQTKYKRYNN